MYGLPIYHLPEQNQHWKGTHCTDKHWANGRIIRWGWILQGFLPSQQQAQVSSLARPVFRSSTYQAVTTPNAGQECLQVASQGQLSQLCPKNCAPSQLWQAPSHLWKPLVNQRPLVWKDLSICPWKWTLLPHKFPGNCPYLLIDWFM